MKRSNFRLTIALLAGLLSLFIILEEGQLGDFGDRYDDTRNQLIAAIDQWVH